jgi:uncharacterized sulfatase
MKNRREFLRIAALGSGAAGFMSWTRAAKRKPNIVFILMDDLGWSDLGCYNNVFHETPHLDRLAGQGMRFTNAYAANPVCSPTRASIMTGQYPGRIGINSYIPGPKAPPGSKLLPPENRQQLPLEMTTIAEALQAEGYRTGCFGKWHLGGRDFFPDQQGFDEILVSEGRHFHFKTTPETPVSDDDYLAEKLTERAERFIRENKDRPFFLYLAHFLAHVPYEAKKQLIEKYTQKPKPVEGLHPLYAAMVEHMDHSVGRIMAVLKEAGIDDDTIVIFTSDNGGLHGLREEGKTWKNLQHRFNEKGELVCSFRGGKSTLYEDGLRVPLIVRWPGGIKPGTRCHTPVCSIDFYPTLLRLAGLCQKPQQILDGCDLTPLFQQNDGIGRDTLFWHYPYYQASTPAGAIRQGRWKLIEFFEDDRVELYNLEQDECEASNLVDQFPQLAQELQEKLAGWRRSLNAAMPTLNPEYHPQR